MVRIPGSKTIYCKSKILTGAMAGSQRATHVCRRLLVGVFTKEAIMTCTIRGQKPRILKKARQSTEVGTLHQIAIAAIKRKFSLKKKKKNANQRFFLFV